jgi:hypothetical protein
MRIILAVCAAWLLPLTVLAQEKPPLSGVEAAHAALLKDYVAWEGELNKQRQAAKSDAERQAIADRWMKRQAAVLTPFLELAAKNPKEEAITLDALAFVVARFYGYPDTLKLRNDAIALLQRDHLNNPQLDRVFPLLVEVPSPAAAQFMQAALEKSPPRPVQGRACFFLGQYWKLQAEVVRQVKKNPELAKSLEPFTDPATVKQYRTADPDQFVAQAEKYLARVAEQYPLVKQGNTTLGKAVEGELYELRHLGLGKVVPEVEGEDVDGRKFKLSDYRGKVVVLTFWGNW